MQSEKPVHEVRLGVVKASIWKRTTPNGVVHDVTFGRLYKDKNKQWKTATTFSRDQCLVLAKVADRANSFIHEQRQTEEPESEDTAAGT